MSVLASNSYDRSESTELNSWWNFYTYSIYRLEMWRPSFAWSSRHPQHIGRSLQAAWKKPLLWTQVTMQSWRAPGAHPEPGPSSEFFKKEVNSRAPKQTAKPVCGKWGWERDFQTAQNPLLPEVQLELSPKENKALRMLSLTQCFYPWLNHHFLMNCVAVFPVEPDGRIYQHVQQ